MTRDFNIGYDNFVDRDSKEVWIHFSAGWNMWRDPQMIVEEYYPGYEAKLCTTAYLDYLREENE